MTGRQIYDDIVNVLVATLLAFIIGLSWGDSKLGLITFVLTFYHLVTMDRLRDIRKMLEEKS